MQTIVLSGPEIEQITGYKRPASQLEELHRQGFYRARRSPTTGNMILEREHYTAVCSGSKEPIGPKVHVPQLRLSR